MYTVIRVNVFLVCSMYSFCCPHILCTIVSVFRQHFVYNEIITYFSYIDFIV